MAGGIDAGPGPCRSPDTYSLDHWPRQRVSSSICYIFSRRQARKGPAPRWRRLSTASFRPRQRQARPPEQTTNTLRLSSLSSGPNHGSPASRRGNMGGCPICSSCRDAVAATGGRTPIGGISAARDAHRRWGGGMVPGPIIAPHAATWPRRGGAVIGRPVGRSRRGDAPPLKSPGMPTDPRNPGLCIPLGNPG